MTPTPQIEISVSDKEKWHRRVVNAAGASARKVDPMTLLVSFLFIAGIRWALTDGLDLAITWLNAFRAANASIGL